MPDSPRLRPRRREQARHRRRRDHRIREPECTGISAALTPKPAASRANAARASVGSAVARPSSPPGANAVVQRGRTPAPSHPARRPRRRTCTRGTSDRRRGPRPSRRGNKRVRRHCQQFIADEPRQQVRGEGDADCRREAGSEGGDRACRACRRGRACSRRESSSRSTAGLQAGRREARARRRGTPSTGASCPRRRRPRPRQTPGTMLGTMAMFATATVMVTPSRTFGRRLSERITGMATAETRIANSGRSDVISSSV